jgi:exodeoxyribonuclease VIII
MQIMKRTKKELVDMEKDNCLKGFFRVTSEDYHAGPGLSKSGLAELLKSDLHFKKYTEGSSKRTKSMEVGAALHTLLLEPQLYNEEYVTQPEDMRKNTKAYKEWFTENKVGKKTVLTHGEKKTVNDMVAQLCASSRAMALLSGDSETAIYTKDEVSGLTLKCRPDVIHRKLGTLVDLKTTKDASPSGFDREVYTYKYHMQAALYLDICNAELPEEIDTFVFVAIDKTAPYGVGLYQLPPEFIEEGRRLYKRALRKYFEGKEFNFKRNYTCGQVLTISPQTWMYTKEEEGDAC